MTFAYERLQNRGTRGLRGTGWTKMRVCPQINQIDAAQKDESVGSLWMGLDDARQRATPIPACRPRSDTSAGESFGNALSRLSRLRGRIEDLFLSGPSMQCTGAYYGLLSVPKGLTFILLCVIIKPRVC